MTKTIAQEINDWEASHENLRSEFSAIQWNQLKLVFIDGYEAGHKSASKETLASIAGALTPEPA